MARSYFQTTGQKPDYVLMILIFVLVVFGLVMLTSATSPVAFTKFDGDSYWYVKHQILVGLIPGLILFFILLRFDYRRLKKLAFPLLVANVVLLLLVFIPGIGAQYGSARSWINVGGFSLQPSEIIKLTFILYLALWLEKRTGKVLGDFYYSFLPFVVMIGIICMLIFFQPDVGTMGIILLTALVVYFIGGGKIRHLLWLSVVIVMGLIAVIKMAEYRASRFMSFLHPELDPEGIGYHINQALLAVGSGGIFGRGFGQSRQKFLYLPEISSDSIFAVIAEELGFILVALFVVLLAYIFYRGIKIAQHAPDAFGKYLAAGIITWLVLQSFLNVGGMIGIVPMTGIPLPFISFGGTALFASLTAMGILLNISKYSKIAK